MKYQQHNEHLCFIFKIIKGKRRGNAYFISFD